MNPPNNLDQMLRDAGRWPTHRAGSVPSGSDGRLHLTDHEWDVIQQQLELNHAALNKGEETPGMSERLAQLVITKPQTLRVYRQLAESLVDYSAGRFPVLDAIPAHLVDCFASDAADTADSEAESPKKFTAVLSAVIAYSTTKLAQLQSQGLDIIQHDLLLARNSGDQTPIAMQGCLDDRYLVSLSVSGREDISKLTFDMQCQEIRPGASSPRSIPSFSLKNADGKRYHSRNRIVHVDLLQEGENIFDLEILGDKKGELILTFEKE
jgi:hypothetical protein